MRPLFSVILIGLLGAGTALAQQEDLAARYQLADSYLQARQYDRAIAVLEDLLADQPGSMPVTNRLKDAYVGAGKLDEAVSLLQQHMGAHGPSPQLLAELGGLHAEAGDREAARRTWREAVETAQSNAQTYRMLYSVMVRSRMWEDARDMLLAGRRALGQPDLFRIELAELYSRSDQHGEALQEWAALLTDSPERLSFIQGRLGRMLDQEGAATAFRDALDRLIRREPMKLTLRRLAAWLASEDGDFSAALDHMRAIDRLGQERGESLLAFAESATQARDFEVANRALDIILDTHEGTATAAAALLASGLLHERMAQQAREHLQGGGAPTPHYTTAANRYRRFLDEHPTLAARPAAMTHLAVLKRDVFGDFDEAQRLLEEVVATYSGTDQGVEARFALGDLFILMDDLTQARITFTRIENLLRIGERAERARFNLALLDYYQGNFEMALSRVNAMKRNTATDVANNAIDLKLVLTELQGAEGSAGPLARFAEAELRARQRRHEEALAALDQLAASHADHPVTPLVRFRRAEALRALGRSEEAVAAFAAIPDEFADSYLGDRALFFVAEIRERDLGDVAAAIDGYTTLLMRFPGSLLAAEARTRIRRLRGDMPSS